MPLDLLPSPLFYGPMNITYPPFKKGFYLEEFFLEHMKKNQLDRDSSGRIYIPCLWTNFQLDGCFQSNKKNMQNILDKWISEHKSENGYFTIVQMDDGILLKLPSNTIIYGACTGTIPLPLIYEDTDFKLESNAIEWYQKNEQNKHFLCSFVGTETHTIRRQVVGKFNGKKDFSIIRTNGWSPSVSKDKQDNFISATLKSKFALAPRGYGKSSFRFFEIIILGTIPIYIWDDIEWLPYKDVLDYTNFSISLHISKLDELESIMESIINSEKYNEMLAEIKKINTDKIFGLDYMCSYILSK